MEIFKFGGTSVGEADSIRRVAEIIQTPSKKIVVLSANGKITDVLSSMIDAIESKNFDQVEWEIHQFEQYYLTLITSLYRTEEQQSKALKLITEAKNTFYSFVNETLAQTDKDYLITLGELLSTRLFSYYLQENGLPHQLLLAKEMIFLDETGRPDRTMIKERVNQILEKHSTTDLFITQGFICSQHDGQIATLGRGGSDFTASLLGEAVNASVIQIWSDVDGFLNNDPGFVRGALPLKYLSFDEAAELAYFGARVLHPSTIYPAKESGIPVLLKNTKKPDNPGTVISEKRQSGDIKAVAAKDGIHSITIHSHQMLLAYGFLKKVFEIFEKYQTSVDMVTTSEVSVSVTIDDTTSLKKILNDLNELGEVTYHNGLSLVCVVGDHLADNKGKVMEVFDALKEIPVKMISYGAAKNSIAMLVETKHKVAALESLNQIQHCPTETTRNYV
jgi:aspartate kinase